MSLQHHSQYVPPFVGRDYSEGGVLLVARDPGANEVDDGEPLVGKSGRLLFGGFDPQAGKTRAGVIRGSGLQRKDLAIANRVPVRPWNNNFSNHNPEHVRQGLEELRRFIDDCNPSLVITTGNEAAFDLVPGWPTLTDKEEDEYRGGRTIWQAKNVSDRRGFFFHNKELDTWVMPTLHPASCLYQPVPNQMLLEIDFRRVGAYLSGDLPREEPPEPEVIRFHKDARPLYDSEITAFDIETTWDGKKFLCFEKGQMVQMADGSRKAIEEVEVGDKLVGFDEKATSGRRQWQISEVEAVEHDVDEVVELFCEDGSSLAVTPDHPVLTEGKSRTWKRAKDLRISRGPNTAQLSYLYEPAEIDPHDAGYLAALVDGEGSIQQHTSGGVRLVVCTQQDNEILSKAERLLDKYGFDYSRYPTGSGSEISCYHLYLRGGTTEVLRFLASVRPLKANNLKDILPQYPTNHTGKRVRGRIWKGEREIVRLRTTSRTLIVNGFASHNCIAFTTDDGKTYLAYESGLGAVTPWLESDAHKIAHNKQFDVYWLKRFTDISVGGIVEDTQAGHHACYPELAGKEDTGREDNSDSSEWTRKGLNFLASFHLNTSWWKTYGGDREEMGRLCAKDTWATLKIWQEQISEDLDYFGVRDQYEQSRDLIPALMKAQERGLKIDESLRLQRLEALEERHERLYRESREAAESFLKAHSITHKENGDEYWWYHDAQCTCCNGGKKKRKSCPSCAGIEPSGSSGFLVSDYRQWAEENTDLSEEALEELNKDDLRQLLPQCKACGGVGKVPSWSFNPMSDTQLPTLLWTYLDVPAKTHGYDEPNAQEGTIKEVRDWANDQGRFAKEADT